MPSPVPNAKPSFIIKKTVAPNAASGSRKLRPYQNDALIRMKDRDGAFFAMEMRLGKTLTVIRWLQTKKAKTIFVIAPKTVLIPWEDELSHEGITCNSLVPLSTANSLEVIADAGHGY